MDQAIGNPQRDADLHGTALHVFLRAVESCLRAHSPGGGSDRPRAGAKRGGAVGSPRWKKMSRRVVASVTKAITRMSVRQVERTSGKAS